MKNYRWDDDQKSNFGDLISIKKSGQDKSCLTSCIYSFPIRLTIKHSCIIVGYCHLVGAKTTHNLPRKSNHIQGRRWTFMLGDGDRRKGRYVRTFFLSNGSEPFVLKTTGT